jgi:hypothetical protein
MVKEVSPLHSILISLLHNILVAKR